MDSTQSEPIVWRIQLKPGNRNQGVNVAAFCAANRIIGIGWGIDEPIADWEDYFKKYMVHNPAVAIGTPGHTRWRTNTHRLIVQMRENDLVWFRDMLAPAYYLGRIIGPWICRNDLEAKRFNIRLVRPVEVVPVGVDVPGKVLAAFRAARTIQKVADESVRELSKLIFNERCGRKVYSLSHMEVDIFQLLDDRETEDLVAIYLQFERGYIFSPTSRYQDNPTFEFFVVKRDSKEWAGVQVKTGNIRLKPAAYKREKLKVFLFSPAGYDGEPSCGVECLEANVLRRFLYDNAELFAPTLRDRIAVVQRRA